MAIASALTEGLMVARVMLGLAAWIVLLAIYRALTLLVFVGVLVGVWRELKPLPDISLAGRHVFEYPVVAGTYVIEYAANNWLPLAIGTIFWCVIMMRPRLRRAERKASSSLTALAALATYFDTAVETDAMKEVPKATFGERLSRSLQFWFFGLDEDDEYTSKPVRGGVQVSFKNDIDDAVLKSNRAPLHE